MMSRSTSDARQRQIDTLKIFNDNVTEVTPNDEYSVGFISSNRQFHLNVHLTPNFPIDKPKLHITPSIFHQWVHGPTGEIHNAPGLLHFTIHSDLGRVVHAIIREFERFPPQLWSNDVVSPNKIMPALIDCNIPELSGLSDEDLKMLNENEESLNDFVEEMSAVQLLTDELDSLICEVEVITEENMSKMDRLEGLRKSIADGYTKLRSLGDKWEMANKKYMEKTEEFSPQHIKSLQNFRSGFYSEDYEGIFWELLRDNFLQDALKHYVVPNNELLQIAVSSADSDCEEHIENFLNGRIDVQSFLDEYTKTKKLSALRKAKEERLSHQLNALERAAL